MLDSNVLLLGGLASLTIFLGLPVARLQATRRARGILNALSVGILLFLLAEVLLKGWAPVEEGFAAGNNAEGARLVATYAAGLLAGLLSLVWFEWHFLHRRSEKTGTPTSPAALSLMIAVGIGLHNFSEGLAIGASAASGALAFAVLLAIGFALHNATEGFGITAPLAGDTDTDGTPRRPSWGFLLMLGLIGGGPTFLGTGIGHAFTSEALSVLFLTLAAGSIIYVVTQLLGIAAKAKRRDLLAYGLLIGLIAGFLTDAVVTVGGA